MKESSHQTNQFGEKSIYIENQNAPINYYGQSKENDLKALEEGSYQLLSYEPSISPVIEREEVKLIQDWISKDADPASPQRVGLLYGTAGIGKSIVMHDLLKELREIKEYKVLGLKSDQIAFNDTEELRIKLHLSNSLEDVLKKLSCNFKRVILLVDQIDALSLSLSSNRAPMRSLLELICKLKEIKNIRIVVSCRPYDLEYDPLLKRLNTSEKWKIKEFSAEKVKETLSINGYKKTINNDMLTFLGNPLHLFLFLKVYENANLHNPLTQEDLYNELWKQVIWEVPNDVKREKVLELLDRLVEKMYEDQQLTESSVLYETHYNQQLSYLLHKEFLIQTKNDSLQFFHQTMFDYVYARRFIEKGKDLLKELSNAPQGLFIRASVKSIISFLRSHDTAKYRKTLIAILTKVDQNGCPMYRFHIRSLVLTTMAFFEEPLEEEGKIIERYLLKDQSLLSVLMDAIHNKSWFILLNHIFDKKGGWAKLNYIQKDKLINICRRVVYEDPNFILDFCTNLIEKGGVEEVNYVRNLLYERFSNASPDKIIHLYHLVNSDKNINQHAHILAKLIQPEPFFVMEELKNNIENQLSSFKEDDFQEVRISSPMKHLYSELERLHPELIVQFYIELLKLIEGHETIITQPYEIGWFIKFLHFERKKKKNAYNHLFEALVNKILNEIEDKCLKKQFPYDDLLEELSNSNLEPEVYIALYSYFLCPLHYKEKIFPILINPKIIANAPTQVSYLSAKLLEVSFSLFNRKQKDKIIESIMSIDVSYEKHFNKERIIKSSCNTYPISWIGRRKGELLKCIPEKELQKDYHKAYLYLLEAQRKWGDSDALELTEPGKVTCRFGYQSLGLEKARKMTNECWKSAMLTYTEDNHIDFSIPDLHGQIELFEQIVEEQPQKRYPLILKSINNAAIPLSYAMEGIKGLLKATQLELAQKVFEALVEQIGDNINKESRHYDLHSFLYTIYEFIKIHFIPKSVFDFLCKAVLFAKETDYSSKDLSDIINVAINQTRGHAGFLLVHCYEYPEYADKLFNTLESIAPTASVITRAGILVDLALLNKLDQERSVELFIKLMHDYAPHLLAMPVHDLNPLVYYVNYAFDQLIPYFEEVIKNESCYEQQIIILWLAWSHTKKQKAEEFLRTICSRSEKARISLIHFLTRLEEHHSNDSIGLLCRLMDDQFYSEQLAPTIDNIFGHIDTIDDAYQIQLTECYLSSKISHSHVHFFYRFLAYYSIKDPIQTIKWLKQSLNHYTPKESDNYSDWNTITEVLIQSYNSIRKFDDESNAPTLTIALDLLDKIMEKSDHYNLINNFLNQLDNE